MHVRVGHAETIYQLQVTISENAFANLNDRVSYPKSKGVKDFLLSQ